ncbi:thioredoxin domain-containing protein [Candidatus Falkowbacteria bacterium]|nr:thioredoxin domain-containing protein [Candidatus Falkowbacteria bacterium]
MKKTSSKKTGADRFAQGSKKRIWLIALGILLILIIISIGMIFVSQVNYYRGLISRNEELASLGLVEQLKKNRPQAVSTVGNHYFGAEDPKVTIVKFSDFTCPYCRNMAGKLRDIALKYPEDVKIIYKDYPVINEEGIDFALAGRCAGEQANMYFWLMHDELFEKQGAIGPENLPTVAESLGLDSKRFNGCLADEKYLENIKADAKEAESLRVQATPTLFMNGYLIPGDLPEEILLQLVKEFINDASIKNQ